MRQLLILLFCAASIAQEKVVEKLSVEEQLEIKTPQLNASEAQRTLDQKLKYYEQLVQQQADLQQAQSEVKAANSEMANAKAKILAAHKCITPTCQLNEKTLEIQRQPEVKVEPKPDTVTPDSPAPAKGHSLLLLPQGLRSLAVASQ
jgi:hypothetical protein